MSSSSSTQILPADSTINDPRRRRTILIGVCIALMAVIASVSGLNVAQPQLALAFDASQSDVLWMINLYTITMAALLLPLGAAGDRWGRKPVLIAGLVVFGVASAAADISDGLVGDLGHILTRSGVGACLTTAPLLTLLGLPHDSGLDPAADAALLRYVLAGGDDYELVFTAPTAWRAQVVRAARISNTPVTRIGRIEQQPGLRLVDHQGNAVNTAFSAFDHFGSTAQESAP